MNEPQNSPSPGEVLTAKQMHVVTNLAIGYVGKEISTEKHTGESAVAVMCGRIYERFGVRNLAPLLIRLIALGILDAKALNEQILPRPPKAKKEKKKKKPKAP